MNQIKLTFPFIAAGIALGCLVALLCVTAVALLAPYDSATFIILYLWAAGLGLAAAVAGGVAFTFWVPRTIRAQHAAGRRWTR